MLAFRRLALVPALCLPLLVGGLPAAVGAQRAGLPEKVTVNDSRTSGPEADLSQVRLEASWYWDSEQLVVVRAERFQAGQQLTVFFDLNGDSVPDGHFNLQLDAAKKPGGKTLRVTQGFRRGGGWDPDGGKKAPYCSGSEGPPVEGGMRDGDREVYIGLDLWSCLGVANPPDLDSGSWRASVRLAKGKKADTAPNGNKWSAPLRGWGPCDPSGGSCA